MAGAVYFLLFLLSKTGDVRVSLEPAWSRDGAVAWELLTRRWAVCRMRWRERMRTRCWRVGAWVLALTLVLSMLLSLENPLPVHEPLAIAHRGGIGGVENTLEAILSAADCGADYAEIDVQLSQDGVPVLFHDGNLRRMAGVGKSIGELTWEELQQLPIADNRHPGEITGLASLEEVLRALSNRPDMGLLIELKPAAGSGAALAGAVIDLVERYGFGGRAMFMSLDYLCLLPIMERHPEWDRKSVV